MATKSTVFKTTSLRLSEKVKDAMKKHSNSLPIKKSVRGEKGSINHFMVYSVLKVLKDEFGENFRYLYPEYYQ